MSKMYLVAGANMFGQWLSEDFSFHTFKSISSDIKTKKFNLKEAQLECIAWSYNIFKLNNIFYLSGSWHGIENQFIKVSIPKECKSLPSNLTMVGNDYNLYLIDVRTHTIWIMSLEIENNIKKINMDIETPLPDKTDAKKLRKDDSIIKAIATNSSLICLTAGGTVYCGILPSHLNTSHCEGKVCDIQCGFEHFVLLTDAGKVYTWGNGRRLQLGHGDIANLESPTEVEALSGIKIVKISAGGWHSLAISEFGDVYAWGWNDTGQLGIKSQPNREQGVLNNEGLKSYPIPTLVDVFDENGKEVSINAKDIACGSRHSAILLEDNSVWMTGFNKYGQIGFSPQSYPKVNYFKKTYQCEQNVALRCGPWSTVFLKCE